jgi:catechol 2,3-dioxygenase-like lactoylglutathione lyase family enzyme
LTFGCPQRSLVDRLHAAGAEAWITVTTPEEARLAAGAGADALVVQGAEAGGHRGGFSDDDGQPVYGLLALLQLVRAEVDAPLVATGGIATGSGIAAALCAGATAVQLGTAFMLAPEAGTSEPHRQALRGRAPTTLTRAFSGRTARGIRNAFIDAHDRHAVAAYPEINSVTAPARSAARAAGDADAINLWAGEAHPLAQERPAAEIVGDLTRAAAAALRRPREAAGDLAAVLETVLYHDSGAREDMERFYGDLLGLVAVSRWPDGVAFRVGDGVLLIFDRERLADRTGPIADHGTSGPDHACLRARGGAYEQLRERLAAGGVRIVHEQQWPGGGRSFYFKDPAGNLLEIADRDIWPPA